MKYYMRRNTSGEVEALGAVCDNARLAPGVTEITAEEYAALEAAIPKPEPEPTEDADLGAAEIMAILSGEVEA